MFDDHLRLLANTHRRTILTALLEENPHSVSPVMSDGGFTDEGVEKRERKRIELRHVHLPKLENSGLIGWDRESDVVVRGPEFREIEPLLTLLADGHGEFTESRPN